MQCTRCGVMLAPGSGFCGSCGQQQQAAPPQPPSPPQYAQGGSQPYPQQPAYPQQPGYPSHGSPEGHAQGPGYPPQPNPYPHGTQPQPHGAPPQGYPDPNQPHAYPPQGYPDPNQQYQQASPQGAPQGHPDPNQQQYQQAPPQGAPQGYPSLRPYPLVMQQRLTRLTGQLFLAPTRLFFICESQKGGLAIALGKGFGGLLGGMIAGLAAPTPGQAPVIDEPMLYQAAQNMAGSLIMDPPQIKAIKCTMWTRGIFFGGKTYALPNGLDKELKQELGLWCNANGVRSAGLVK